VTLGRSDKEPHPFYMEAELNSPMVQLGPAISGESHGFDTEWFPTRGDNGIQAVKDSGVLVHIVSNSRLESAQLDNFNSRIAAPAPLRLASRISEYLRDRSTPGAPARNAA
jgi:hypothetical protein